MPIKNSKGDRNLNHVQKYIGTAYDEVKIVADNIQAVIDAANNLDYPLVYLGPHATPPSTRVDGSPIEDGDYFFNTTKDSIDYYDMADDTWLSIDPSELLGYRDDAQAASASASLSETNAENSATASADSATASSNSAAAALASQNAASTSETNAANSESAAAASETAAENSNIAAGISETNASNSANAAATSETNAGISETNAANSATASADSAASALGSEMSASASASAALTSETNSANSAAAALTSETNAANSESAASTSESNAAASEAEATAQADRAENFANTMANGVVFKGDWDASTGNFPTPTLSPEKADQYLIAVGGTMSDGQQPDVTVKAQDFLIWNPETDVWIKNENLDRVLSVNGLQGNVVIGVSDISGLQDQIDTKANITDVVEKTSDTGKALLPVGTSAEGGTPDKGALRYDDELGSYVGGNGIVWSPIGGGGGVTWEAITANTVARTGKGYMVNAPDLVVTLMGDPQQGDTVGIGDYFGKNYGVTVTSAKKIMGLDENFSFQTMNANIVFSYVDDTVGYVLTQGFGESDAPQAIANTLRLTDVSGQSVFSFPVTTSLYTDVFYNGVKLDREMDYTVDSEAETVTLNAPVKLSKDIIEIYGWNQALVLNASDIVYDNTSSGLTGSTMQSAIDELALMPNPNLLINSDFSIWQRGSTAISHISNSYACDRWRTVFDQGSANVYRANADSSNLAVFNGSRHGIAVDTFTGGVSSYEHTQRIESLNCQELLQGTAVTISFSVFTTDGNPVSVGGRIWSAGDYDDWTAQENMTSGLVKTVSNGERYTTTLILPTDDFLQGMQVGIGVYAINAGQTVALHQAKVEVSNISTGFVPDNTEVNLSKCQRYFYNGLNNRYGRVASNVSTSWVSADIIFPTTMRSAPIVTAKSYTNWNGTITQVTTEGFHASGSQVDVNAASSLNGYTADAEL